MIDFYTKEKKQLLVGVFFSPIGRGYLYLGMFELNW